MKKYLFLIIILLVIVVGVIYYINGNRNDGVTTNAEMCKVTYTASYNTQDLLGNLNYYEVVKSESKLNSIIKKAKDNNYDNRFNAAFFKKMSLLVIQGGVDTELAKNEVTKDKVDIVVYHGSPLSLPDTEYEFDLYLIPIEKNLTNINLQVLSYPDRMY